MPAPLPTYDTVTETPAPVSMTPLGETPAIAIVVTHDSEDEEADG